MRSDSLPLRRPCAPQYVTREQAISICRRADENGKNKDSDYQDSFNYLRPVPYIIQWLPLAWLDYIAQNDDREEFYAAVSGDFPPVYGLFGPRRATVHPDDDPRLEFLINITNGNHRCRAAEKRGESLIRVLMPADDFNRFSAALAKVRTHILYNQNHSVPPHLRG